MEIKNILDDNSEFEIMFVQEKVTWAERFDLLTVKLHMDNGESLLIGYGAYSNIFMHPKNSKIGVPWIHLK